MGKQETRVWRFAEGESTAASPPFGGLRPPPNARNVENFHCLIFHGIVRNSEVRNFHCLIFHGIVRNSEVQILNSL
jgi:hypothetical protein